MCNRGPLPDGPLSLCRSFQPSVGRSSRCGSRSTCTSTLHTHITTKTSAAAVDHHHHQLISSRRKSLKNFRAAVLRVALVSMLLLPAGLPLPNIAILDLSNAISRKQCKIGAMLLLITNRKSHMSFRLVPNSVTLDDREWRNSHIRILISPNSVAFGADYVKVVEDTPVLSAAEK